MLNASENLPSPLISRHFTDTVVKAPATRVVTVELHDTAGQEVIPTRHITALVDWSDRAVLIAASKYMRHTENAISGMIERVCSTITEWGVKDNYFTRSEASIFHDELFYILLTQRAAFNSPVWFNVGWYPKPQCSACFILKVDDTMESILKWYRDEGMIFKGGSGAGTNLSALRSKHEELSGRGYATGPLSFMRAADASAGAIKSGGKTRRAAKMVILNADHPEIEDFIWCKVVEEDKAKALIAAGYSTGLDGDAYATVAYQNANNSVRVSDDFMQAVCDGATWRTHYRKTAGIHKIYPTAGLLFQQIAEAAWTCGDPGLQFDDTIQSWHTCPEAGRINASNPCSEYFHLDNTACNLASLNLMRFLKFEHKPQQKSSFLIDDFVHTVKVMTTAMDLIVSNAGYPTEEIERNAHKYRELGLGYANLGAGLMVLGLPYDSDRGRKFGAATTALLNGVAYHQSGRLGSVLGPAEGLEPKAMLRVLQKHESACSKIEITPDVEELIGPIADAAMQHCVIATNYSKMMRNTQATVLAPTGTIALLMDCDTTGIEPAIGLVATKELVGGGVMKMEINCIELALQNLGYDDGAITRNLLSLRKFDHLNELREGDEQIFATAFGASNTLSPEAHIKMVAACQPHVSGGISKTVNLPATATVEDVKRFYMEAWKLGLKSVSVYRDGCKGIQPLHVGVGKAGKDAIAGGIKNALAGGVVEAVLEAIIPAPVVVPAPYRRRLPDERPSLTHKFEIAGHKGYITAGMYPDGTLGEVFVAMNKQGSTVAGFMDAWATMVSFALQHGLALEFIVSKFEHTRFEPSGFTKNPEIHHASSILDYVARWLKLKFIAAPSATANLSQQVEAAVVSAAPLRGEAAAAIVIGFSDAPPCKNCGALMRRQGTCYQCFNCGENTGC